MRTLAVVTYALLTSFSIAETQKLNIEFNGAKSGESIWTVNADGTFSGSANISISTIKLISEVTGKRVDGVVSEINASFNLPQGKGKISYHPGTMDVVTDKGKQSIKYDLRTNNAVMGGNLIPQMFAESLTRVKFENKTAQRVNVFLADVGGELSISFTPGATKSIKPGAAKLYTVAIANVTGQLATDASGKVVGFDVPAQKLRWIAEGWESVFVDPFAKYPELSQATFGVRTLPAQKMKTRDGVELVADVSLPDKPGKYPVILTRTPYGRASDMVAEQWYVQHGYAVVAQDCRGRGASGGEWDPFIHERKDGYDAVDWVSQQEWCDGNVGMIGGSYGGYVQWSAAVERHPALKCIIPQVSPPDAMHNIPYEYGTFMLYANLWWARIVQGKDADMTVLKKPMPHPDKLLALPLSKVDDEALGTNIPFFDTWLKRYKKSDWKGFDYTDDITKVKIPALHISGWWDGDGIGTKLNWEALRAAGHKNQWLIYGPWVHAFNTNTSFGGVDYGKQAILELDPVFLRFFDTYLKQKAVGWDKVPRVRAFVTGTNKWINLSDWPDAKLSETTRLYFSAPKGAIAPKQFGSLVSKPVSDQKPTNYTYDPSKEKVDKAFTDLNEKSNTTVLKFEADHPSYVCQTPVLSKPLTVGGPITVHVTFSTSAKDTDLFGMIVDIDAKGQARILGMPGKIRASYIASLDNPAPITPNKKYEAVLHLWDTAHQFAAGHRMGIVVMSSGFPGFARNLGTGEPPFNATRMVKQVNTIYTSPESPSYVEFQRFKSLP